MADKSVSLKDDKTQAKAPGNLIVDQFLSIQRTMHLIGAARDGMREASVYQELVTWQHITDMALEYAVYRIFDALNAFCETFEGLELEPLDMSSYSLLRHSADMPPLSVDLVNGKGGAS